MIQFGSYGELQRAVETFRYKPGWEAWLSGMTHGYSADTDFSFSPMTFGSGQTVISGPSLLHVRVQALDSGGDRPHGLPYAMPEPDGSRVILAPPEPRVVSLTHTFSVPDLDMMHPDGFAWTRWLFDRILDVERHEAMEFFEADGRKPFFPDHGGGYTGLYEIREKP